jgi:phage-related protein
LQKWCGESGFYLFFHIFGLLQQTGYDGLFEVKIEFQSNIYRIFCCFDEGRLIVLFNGFQKKTQKTPPNEIEKAMKLKKEYFEFKKQKT